MTALVVGAGLAGLVAARRLVAAGYRVCVLEASKRIGGMIRPVTLAGQQVDGGAEAYATRSTAAADLCAELGLDVAEPFGQPHVWWPDQITPLADGVLGVPGSLDDPALAALLPEDRARLAEDLTLGPLPGSDATTLGQLVRARMGDAAVNRLVAPLARGVYGTDPELLPLATFAPKLIETMTSEGSLLAAVTKLRQPGSAAVEQPVGGMFRLIEALAKGVDIRFGVAATRLHRDDSRVIVETPAGPFVADRVVLTAPAAVSARLLAGLDVTLPELPTRTNRVALLATDHPGLADHPVGSGLLLGEASQKVKARALSHYSYKWSWVQGPHVLRLSYGDTEVTKEQLVADASMLTKLDLTGHVLDWKQLTHTPPQRVSPETRQRIVDSAARVGVEVLGCWVDGNGIGPIVEAGERLA